jgi:hypothetical protein
MSATPSRPKKAIMNRRKIRFVVLAAAFGLAIALTWFGTMDAAWSEPGKNNPFDVFLIGFIPLLSVPTALIYLLWKGTPAMAIWALALGQWAAFSWLNWTEFAHGDFTAANTALIALSGITAPPVWLWLGIAIAFQIERRLRESA